MRTGFDHLNESLLYADYQRRLDAQAVLDHYGAENQRTEINRHDGTTEIIHSCLIDRVERHHANGDQNPSAACNLEKKLYACYVWWSGDLFHFIQKMEGQEGIDGIIPVVGEFLGEKPTSEEFRAEVDRFFAAIKGGAYSAGPSQYDKRILAPWAFAHPYLAERGIDHDTASRLHIGWDERTNRITIPHFWQGHLVGWQARAIPDRPGAWPGTVPAVPKYKSNSGFPKADTLYGFDEAVRRSAETGRVIVVESPFSVIKAAALHVAGYGVVATFGAKVSKAQIALLREFPKVTVWMDDDAAGRIAERKIVTALHRLTSVDVVTPDIGKDLGDCCSVQEVEHKLATTEKAFNALRRYKKEVSR